MAWLKELGILVNLSNVTEIRKCWSEGDSGLRFEFTSGESTEIFYDSKTERDENFDKLEKLISGD